MTPSHPVRAALAPHRSGALVALRWSVQALQVGFAAIVAVLVVGALVQIEQGVDPAWRFLADLFALAACAIAALGLMAACVVVIGAAS